MSSLFRPIAVLVLAFSAILASADEQKPDRELRQRVEQAGEALDKIEHHMATWGHASISGFVLMPDKGTNRFFDLRYDQTSSNYIAAIRTNFQGQAAFLEQTDFAMGIAARAANAIQGLNVQAPAAALTAEQTAAAQRQNDLNDAIYKIQKAQLDQYFQSVTNSTTNTFSGLFNPYGDKGAPSAPTNTPTGPTNLVPEMPKVTLTLPDAAFTNKFAPVGKLVDGLSAAQISENSILKLAMTAKETERVLNFMSHPVNLGDDKHVFFAVGQISVMPGWRTRQDYVCEVSARFSYSGTKDEILERITAQPKALKKLLQRIRRRGEKLEISDQEIAMLGECMGEKSASQEQMQKARNAFSIQFNAKTDVIGADSKKAGEKFHAYDRAYQELAKKLDLSPTKNMSVVSAFPFMESQVLDLHNSYRSQMTFLMNLAATYLQAGYKIEFETLMRYIKQVQKDFSTRTAFPTVVPGVDSSVVTYRFDPEATAMTEPGDKKPKSGNILLPTSIPVLVLVIVEQEEWEMWPKISVDVETRWIPRKNKTIWKNIADGITKNRIVDKRYRQSQDLELAYEWDFLQSCLKDKLGAVCCGADADNSETHRELERKLAFFENVAWGRSAYLDLPEPEVQQLCCNRSDMKISKVFPQDGFINGRTTFAVQGENFIDRTDPVTSVIVAGRLAENVIVHSDKLLTFEVPAWSDKTDLIKSLEKEVELVLVSRCSAVARKDLVKFTKSAPKSPQPSAGGDGDKAKSLPDLLKEVRKTTDQLRDAITDTNISGVIKYQFQIGKPEGATNSPAGSSTVINVQAGQNANTQR